MTERKRPLPHTVACTTETCEASCVHVPVVRYRPDPHWPGRGTFEMLTPAGRWWPLEPVSKWQVEDPGDLHD